MTTVVTQPQIRTAQLSASPDKGCAIRTRVLQGERTAKIERGVENQGAERL